MQAFISRCFGTYQVGFTLIALGLSSGITSMVYGKLVKYVPRLFIFLFGGALDIGLLVFISVWTLQPSYVFIFLFAVLWGAGDGVWNTMTTSESCAGREGYVDTEEVGLSLCSLRSLLVFCLSASTEVLDKLL